MNDHLDSPPPDHQLLCDSVRWKQPWQTGEWQMREWLECTSLLQTSWVTEHRPMLEKRVFCERLQSQCLVWLDASRVISENCPFVNLTLQSLHIWYTVASKWSQTLLYTIYDMPSHLIDSYTFCKTVHLQVVIHVLWNF